MKEKRSHLPLAMTALCLITSLGLAQQTPLQKKDTALAPPKGLKTKLAPGYTIPIVDISGEKERQVIVDPRGRAVSRASDDGIARR